MKNKWTKHSETYFTRHRDGIRETLYFEDVQGYWVFKRYGHTPQTSVNIEIPITTEKELIEVLEVSPCTD